MVLKRITRKKGDVFLKIKFKADSREEAEELMKEIKTAIMRHNRLSDKKFGYRIKCKINS